MSCSVASLLRTTFLTLLDVAQRPQRLELLRRQRDLCRAPADKLTKHLVGIPLRLKELGVFLDEFRI